MYRWRYPNFACEATEAPDALVIFASNRMIMEGYVGPANHPLTDDYHLYFLVYLDPLIQRF